MKISLLQQLIVYSFYSSFILCLENTTYIYPAQKDISLQSEFGNLRQPETNIFRSKRTCPNDAPMLMFATQFPPTGVTFSLNSPEHSTGPVSVLPNTLYCVPSSQKQMTPIMLQATVAGENHTQLEWPLTQLYNCGFSPCTANGYLILGTDVHNMTAAVGANSFSEYNWDCALSSDDGPISLRVEFFDGSGYYMEANLNSSLPSWSSSAGTVSCSQQLSWKWNTGKAVKFYGGERVLADDNVEVKFEVPSVWTTEHKLLWNGAWDWASTFQQLTPFQLILYPYPQLQPGDSVRLKGSWYDPAGPAATCTVSPFGWKFTGMGAEHVIPTTFYTTNMNVTLTCDVGMCVTASADCVRPLSFHWFYPPLPIVGLQTYFTPSTFPSTSSKIQTTAVFAQPEQSGKAVIGKNKNNKDQVPSTTKTSSSVAVGQPLAITPQGKVAIPYSMAFDGSSIGQDSSKQPWECATALITQLTKDGIVQTSGYEVKAWGMSIPLNKPLCVDYFHYYNYTITDTTNNKELQGPSHSSPMHDLHCILNPFFPAPVALNFGVRQIIVTDTTWVCGNDTAADLTGLLGVGAKFEDETGARLVQLVGSFSSYRLNPVTGLTFPPESAFPKNVSCPDMGCPPAEVVGDFIFEMNTDKVTLGVWNKRATYKDNKDYHPLEFLGFVSNWTLPTNDPVLAYEQTEHDSLTFKFVQKDGTTPWPTHFEAIGNFPFGEGDEVRVNASIAVEWSTAATTDETSYFNAECTLDTSSTKATCAFAGFQDLVLNELLPKMTTLKDLHNQVVWDFQIITMLTPAFVLLHSNTTEHNITVISSAVGQRSLFTIRMYADNSVVSQYWYAFVIGGGAAVVVGIVALIAARVVHTRNRRGKFTEIKGI